MYKLEKPNSSTHLNVVVETSELLLDRNILLHGGNKAKAYLKEVLKDERVISHNKNFIYRKFNNRGLDLKTLIRFDLNPVQTVLFLNDTDKKMLYIVNLYDCTIRHIAEILYAHKEKPFSSCQRFLAVMINDDGDFVNGLESHSFTDSVDQVIFY